MSQRWTADVVRQTFLKFFEERGHQPVPSSSLVPADPTLLFTNAGMVPFKRVFTGQEQRPYRRATSAQKCLRVSGKHNDLENVGPSPRHHTFFEMLGNFSFGDYFKRDAITYAWELLTKVYRMPKDRFHFTIYRDDEESFKLWQEIAGAPAARIHRMGEKTNFWMMGDTGPCGPNSELIWDRGPEFCTCKQADCSPHLDNDCDRWSEVWNLVFMQFDQDESGRRTELPKPGVDTGMGFERLVAILQSAKTNYDTDVFQPIMERVRELSGQTKDQMQAQIVPYRVLADHGRAMTFLLADGVVPGNEKQKYVLRMIMRRAIRFAKKLNLPSPFLTTVVEAVISRMGDAYPELIENRSTILRWVEQEEQLFDRTLDRGLDDVKERMSQLKHEGKTVISGEDAFRWHDQDGFPIEVTEDVARENGFTVDRAGFEREMEKQRTRSRESITVTSKITFQLKMGATKFDKDKLIPSLSNELVNIIRADIEASSVVTERDLLPKLSVGKEGIFRFSETPFYAEGGGQVADQGMIHNCSDSHSGHAQVYKVIKTESGTILHFVMVIEGDFYPSDLCELQIDVERRRPTMRNHTATHILHKALREVLGYPGGIQAGSLVAPDELRFDFTHPKPLTEDEIKRIEEISNHVILSDLPVEVTEEKLEEAKSKGAMALFTEDYQGKEKVRMVSIIEQDGKPFSRELCGGTHVKHTGEIGLFKVISEEGIAAGVRRVRVATGENLLKYLTEREIALHQMAQRLSTPEAGLLDKLDALLAEREHQEEEMKHLRRALLDYKRAELLQQHRESLDDFSLLRAEVDLETEALKELADRLIGDLGEGIVLLGTQANGKAVLVCKVSDGLSDRFHAGKIVREMAQVVGGKGGGNQRFAQGGGENGAKLAEALERGAALIRRGSS
jgi:alanyl-tRNA synthetase